MSTHEQMRKVDSLRKILRKNIDKFHTTKKDQLDNYDRPTCTDFKACLNNYKERLDKLDYEYLDLLPNADDEEAAIYDAEVEEVMEYSNKVILSLNAIDERLTNIQTSTQTATVNTNLTNNTNNGTMTNNNGHSKAKLKPLELPTYSGKETENFAEFLDTVEEMLEGRGLDNIEKFIHFKNCLSGDPLHAIAAFGHKNDSYDRARQKLIEIFLNSDEKKFKLLNALNGLRYNYSKDTLLSFFGNLDTLLKEIETTQIDIKYVIQYFAWNSIRSNRMLADIYRKVTDEAYPTLTLIQDKQNKVMRLYNEQQAEYKAFKARKNQMFNKNKATDRQPSTKSNTVTENSLAANIPNSRYSNSNNNEKKMWCYLCKGTNYDHNHAIYKCPQFITSKQKLARLNILKNCLKCGRNTHTSNKCDFIFRNQCKYCNGPHFPWICPNNENAKSMVEFECESTNENSDYEEENVECEENENERSEDEYEDEIEDVKVTMVSTRANKSCLPSNAILPTFKGRVNGIDVRGLKDSGAQKCFISSSLVKNANLKPGQKVELTVSGFNSAKTYQTYEVKVPLQFGGKTFNLDMIILPEVSTKFSADGISSVAVGFEEKGYVLADPELKYDRNMVGNMDMVLGISATHVFMEKVRTYGENDSTYFLETIGGIMPIGHSLQSYSNLKYLPHADKNAIVNVNCKLNKINLSTNSNVIPKLKTKNPELKKSKTSVRSKSRTRSKSRSKSRSRSKNRVLIKKDSNSQIKKKLTKTSEINKSILKKPKPVLKIQSEKPKSNVKFQEKVKVNKKGVTSIATPATIEVRACTLPDHSDRRDSDSEDNINDSETLLDTYQLGDIGKNFLQSLTPGYTKQQYLATVLT